MADLGTIGDLKGIQVYRRRLLWGTLRISGTTKVTGLSAPRWVRLYSRPSGELVDSVRSNADGTYEFANLAAGQYTVVVMDDGADYNALVYDRVNAVV